MRNKILLWSFILIALSLIALDLHLEKQRLLEQLEQDINSEQNVQPEPIPRNYGRTYVGTVWAWVTGYNTVPAQTDSTPCIAANGENICGMTNVVACPRAIPFDTLVEIDGKVYRCVDRLALKYDDRFDISCDKDFLCPEEVHGYKEVKILS